MNLKLLVIRCLNIEKSKAFYEKLGFIFVLEKHGKGVEHYCATNYGFVFELYPSNKDNQVCNTRLGFELLNKENLISEYIDSYDFNNKTIYILQDPDGRKIEIY